MALIDIQTSAFSCNSHLDGILEHLRLQWNYWWIKSAKEHCLGYHEYMHDVGLHERYEHQYKNLINSPINPISWFFNILIS